MELQKQIEKQFQEHRNFANSFKEASTAFGREFYHPRTGKRITWSKMCSLIDEDAKKRTNKILELLK